MEKVIEKWHDFLTGRQLKHDAERMASGFAILNAAKKEKQPEPDPRARLASFLIAHS